MLTLRVTEGPKSGRLISVRAGQKVTVGRTESADVALDDGFMSGVHFELSFERGIAALRDLQSRNGTFVNGQQVIQSPLADGDRVRAGNSELQVELKKNNAMTSLRMKISDLAGYLFKAAEKPSSAVLQMLRSVTRMPSSMLSGVRQPAPNPSPIRETQPKPPARPEMSPVPTVHLLVLGPNEETRKLWIKAGESFTVGSSTAADVIFEFDSELSRVHMRWSLKGASLQIEDLASSNGVFVNSDRITERRELHDRDVVIAGRTLFTVRIELTDPPALPIPLGQTISSEPLPSGIVLFSPKTATIEPLEMLRRLSTFGQLSVILSPPVDFELKPFSLPIFNWLPDPVAGNLSPRVLANDDKADVWSILEQQWGHDRVVCVLAEVEPEIVLDCLASAARGQAGSSLVPDPSQAISDWRPSAIRTRLASSSQTMGSFLFESLAAIIVEGDQERAWSILATQDFEATLSEALSAKRTW